MILALDTSTAACTAALLLPDGTIVSSRDEEIGRGHAERLVPLIAEMLDGHVPTRLLVGVGPGSFTGLRVGIAASHGLAVGWSIPLSGMNSLALLAASAPPGEGHVAAAVSGGLGRFSYALLLAEMRADLAWSYVTAGAMNTVNAVGYLGGALRHRSEVRAA